MGRPTERGSCVGAYESCVVRSGWRGIQRRTKPRPKALLSDDGKLVGVNSFKSVGTEGLNFAVAASEVPEFLNAPVVAAPCEWKVVFEGRNRTYPL
jgi:hypothetical protein